MQMTTLKPPFRGEDMEDLFKKVIRGYYPRIPPHYSSDLNTAIKLLLQVTPGLRPESSAILQLPIIQKRYFFYLRIRFNENLLIEADDEISLLLKTIRIPKNIN